MFKLAMLLKRPSRAEPEEFQSFWSGTRGPRLREEPGLRRYVQSRPLPQSYRKGQPPYDGLEEFWFDDEAEATAFADRVSADPRADAPEHSLGVGTLTLAVQELLITDGKPGPLAVKSVIINRRRAGMTPEAFLEYWQTRHAEIAGQLPRLRRYEQNPLLQSPRWRSEECDGISLAWFDSLDDLKALVHMPEYELALQDEANFLEDGGHLPIVLTREHVLVDR